jgi:hypothetical protein
MRSFPFPLSLLLPLVLPKEDPDADCVSHPVPHPSPSMFASFASRVGDRLTEPRRRGEASSIGNNSGLPKASGLDPAWLGGAGGTAGAPVLLPLLPLRPRELLELDSARAMLSTRREPAAGAKDAGDAPRGGDSRKEDDDNAGRLPARPDPLTDRFVFIRSDPGVVTVGCCGRLCGGLDGLEIDFWVDAGLTDRLPSGAGLALCGRLSLLACSSASSSELSRSEWDDADEVSELRGTVIA